MTRLSEGAASSSRRCGFGTESRCLLENHGRQVVAHGAELAGGSVAEMGDEVMLADGPELVAEPPRVEAGEDAAKITVRIVLADKPEGTEVPAGSAGTLRFRPTKAGAYRVEVRVVPNHLGPWMGTAKSKLVARELPWVLANPIYVKWIRAQVGSFRWAATRSATWRLPAELRWVRIQRPA